MNNIPVIIWLGGVLVTTYPLSIFVLRTINVDGDESNTVERAGAGFIAFMLAWSWPLGFASWASYTLSRNVWSLINPDDEYKGVV